MQSVCSYALTSRHDEKFTTHAARFPHEEPCILFSAQMESKNASRDNQEWEELCSKSACIGLNCSWISFLVTAVTNDTLLRKHKSNQDDWRCPAQFGCHTDKSTCKGPRSGMDLLLRMLVMFLKNAHNASAHYKICFTLLRAVKNFKNIPSPACLPEVIGCPCCTGSWLVF